MGVMLAVILIPFFRTPLPIGSPPPVSILRVPRDPITDFYHPPEKRSSWFERAILHKNWLMPHTSTPVNIHTRGILDDYQQVGILSGNDLAGVPTVAPLMGRRSPAGNMQWQYYTIFNGSGSIIPVKLPVTSSGKMCSGDRGCTELQTGDTVSTEGYGTDFRVTIYTDDAPRYI